MNQTDSSGGLATSHDVKLPFDEKHLPVLLQEQISKLNDLDESVKKAIKAAEDARSKAKRAAEHSAGWFEKKEAIEELQSASVELAGAVADGAKAQKVFFEYQKKLADISKFLFALGISNIAANRMVVRELEMRLKGASKQQISDLARQELMGVIQQLKDQEDLMIKQERASHVLGQHDQRLGLAEQSIQTLKEGQKSSALLQLIGQVLVTLAVFALLKFLLKLI